MKSAAKSKRLDAIVKIIDQTDIDGQDQLLKMLSHQGFTVTQATLSRDINELKIIKVPDGKGGYRYSRHHNQDTTIQPVAISAVVSIEVSGQMAVLRTRPGFASMMAATIDDARLSNVMGTLAGDDTVLLVLRQGTEAGMVISQLKKVIPDIENKVL